MQRILGCLAAMFSACLAPGRGNDRSVVTLSLHVSVPMYLKVGNKIRGQSCPVIVLPWLISAVNLSWLLTDLRRFYSLPSQDMHVHVHVWMFLMRWFYFSEGWLDLILNKHLGHPHTPSEEGSSYNKSKTQSLKHQREDWNLAHLFFF